MGIWLQVVVLTFATFRVTRLVTRDDFPPILWARNRIVRARPGHLAHKWHSDIDVETEHVAWWLAELVLCGWCASAYISGGLVAATWWRYGMPAPLLIWLAVWGAAAYLWSKA